MVQHVKSGENMAYISVIGAGECDQRTYETAYQVGREAGRRGAIVVCGGLGGVMDGAARGAREGGGLAVGILPGENRLGSSRYLHVALPTGLGYARNTLVVLAGDAVIAVGGEFGTLSEIGLALKFGKPVIGIDTWLLDKETPVADPIIRAKDAAEAVEKALALIRKDP